MELELLPARVESDADRELEPVVSLPSVLVRAGLMEIDPNNLEAIADHDGFVSLPPASYFPLVVNFWLGRNPLNDLPQQFCGVGPLDYLPPRLVDCNPTIFAYLVCRDAEEAVVVGMVATILVSADSRGPGSSSSNLTSSS